MAALMTAPMAIIEILLMGSPHKRVNMAIAAGALTLLAAAWLAIRYQAGIGDEQFVKSMIPHHSGRHPDVRRGKAAGCRTTTALH